MEKKRSYKKRGENEIDCYVLVKMVVTCETFQLDKSALNNFLPLNNPLINLPFATTDAC